ncbi:MAG: hypothetical protein WA726_11950 [Acidimicrobiia bacterium]
MNRRRLITSLVASVVVIAAVVVIIILAVIPLPEFANLPEGKLTGSLTFVDEDNCVLVADLGKGTVTELRCEGENNYIEYLVWTEKGVEETTFQNRATTRVLDPVSGEVLETNTGDESYLDRSSNEDPMDGLVTDQPESGVIVLLDSSGTELLRLEAPERYYITSAAHQPDGNLIAIADSSGRLGVFEPGGSGPYLVADNVRPWPAPVWAP